MPYVYPSRLATAGGVPALGHLPSDLLALAEHGALGLLLGAAGSRMLRKRGLHWSWAAVPVPVAVLLHVGLGVLTPASTLLACAFAISRGRRWHCEDLEDGGDLARAAAERSGPLALLASAARRASLRRTQLRGRSCVRGGRVAVGADDRSATVTIPFGGADGGGTHTLVVGATGSGKTVTEAWIAERAIEHGMAVVAVDPKGDRALRSHLARAGRTVGREFIEWSPAGGSIYNPCSRGSDTEIADKVLAAERFTEPHYQRQAQRYIGHAVRAMRVAGMEVSMREIVAHLEPERLELLARELPGRGATITHDYLDSLTRRQRADLAGVRDRLAIITESEVGTWLDPDTPGWPRLDLLAAARAGSVVYFGLESDSRPLLAQMLGAAIIQDLQTAVAALQHDPAPTLVLIDEFSAIAAEQVVRLFGRARSAGVSLLLGTQELADLRIAGAERLLEQVLGNLSTLIAHRQVVPGSAQLIAGLAGSRGVWRTTRNSDGRSTRTRTRESVLEADDLMGLERGAAAVIALDARARACIARMFAPVGVR